MDAEKHGQPLRVSVLGMDERGCNVMRVFFQVQFKNSLVLVEDESADICIFDLDGYSSKKQWDEYRQLHPQRPTIALSLQEVEKIDGVFLRKPLKPETLKAAFKGLIERMAEEREQPPVPVPTAVEESDPDPLPEPSQTDLQVAAEGKKHVGSADASGQRNTHDAAGMLSARDIKNVVGTMPDIDPSKSKHLANIQYDPKDFLQHALKKAFDRAREKKGYVKLETPYGGIVVLPGGQSAQLQFSNVRHLRTLSSLPAERGELKIVALGENNQGSAESSFPMFRADALLWQTALYSARGRIPAGTALNVPVCLTVWPNMTRLIVFPHALRIAALWFKQPHSLLETAKVLGIPQRYVFAFYSAANALGVAFTTRRSADLLFEPPPIENNQKRSLFGRILDRLRNT